MKNYTVMNLSMISRLAVLENAERTGKAIDSLVAILRYEKDMGDSISTVEAELKIIEKIFYLHQQRKGPGFCGVIDNKLEQDKCYITKGKLVSFVSLAISKRFGENKDCLEVIISVEEKDDQVIIRVKDNGEIHENEHRQSLVDEYKKLKHEYDDGKNTISIIKKPGIGTRVKIRV